MTKIINKPSDTVSQVLNGVAFIHQDRLERVGKTGIIKRKGFTHGKVGLVSGGGSGHEPAHFGFVGKGMLDVSVSGPIFTPPSASEIVEAICLADQGRGVLLIIKNFEADVTVFLEAERQATADGIHVKHVIVNDDCSIEEGSYRKRRRGVAGTIFVHKILGAAADEGMSLEDLEQLGNKVILSMNTLGVALASGKELGSEQANFELETRSISFGIGIHGESGYRTEPFVSSEHLANELMNKLLLYYPVKEEASVALMINGLGTTTLMEQYVFGNDVRRLLELENVPVSYTKLGNFMTSMDMGGISLTFLVLEEMKWLEYLQATTDAFAW